MISLLFHDSAMLLHAYSQLYTTTSPGLVLLFAGPRGEETCQGTKNSLVWKKKVRTGFQSLSPQSYKDLSQDKRGKRGQKGYRWTEVLKQPL